MIVVSDASPLIALASIDRLDLLGRLFDAVIIPTAVHTEVFGTSIHRRPILPGFIRLTPVSQASSVRFLRLNLHVGESEAIALALEHGIERIILDDKQARETANRLGLMVVGTLGILILAKQKGHLMEIRPLVLSMMTNVNFRLSPSILNRALAHVGEPLL